MPNIVLSYRRSDSAAMAGRIRDRLAARFGEDRVFIDLDSIPVGTDFRDHIQKALKSCDVLLVLMGDKWRGLRADGPARIMEPNDPVLVEVESALADKVPMIPVLLDGADMPSAADVPASLDAFTYLNAAHVESGRDFSVHMERLIRAITSIKPEAPAKPKRPAWLIPLAAAALVAIAATAAWLLTRSAPEQQEAAPGPTPAMSEPIGEKQARIGSEGDRYGDWVVSCAQGRGLRRDCYATSRPVAGGTDDLTMSAYFDDAGARTLVAHVSDDANIASGITLGAEGINALSATFETCDFGACSAAIVVPEASWPALRDNGFTVAWLLKNGNPASATMSARGLDDAFNQMDRPARKPAAAE